MKYTLKYTLKKWFSIIEVMIGVFIFSLGLVAIYALLISSLNLSEYNKNAIIASQLAVEQIEIIRNIRDTNYETVRSWDNIPGISQSLTDFNEKYLKVENDDQNWYILTQIDNFNEWQTVINWVMQNYRLCLYDNVYTYDCTSSDAISTPFYRYLKIESRWNDRLLLSSKVIWYSRGYHEFEVQTLITDWRRL